MQIHLLWDRLVERQSLQFVVSAKALQRLLKTDQNLADILAAYPWFKAKLASAAMLIAGGLFGTFSTPILAAETFDNTGIQFDVDTVVEFEFVKSQGAYQSTFGVINLDNGEKTPLIVETKPSDIPQDVTRPSNFQDDSGPASNDDFLGTPGNTVTQPLAEFQFQANTRYAFYLESLYNGRSVGILYSTNAQNSSNRQGVRFAGDVAGLNSGGTVIHWDDTGSVLVRDDQQDMDFDDFIVRSGGRLACPYEGNVSSKQLKECENNSPTVKFSGIKYPE